MPIGCTRRGTACTPFTCIRRRLNTLVSGEPNTILAQKTFSLLRLPSFCIRTCRDVTVLRRLRQAFKLAVHAAMAGKTGLVIGYLHDAFIHIPIEMLVLEKKQINPDGFWWKAVLETTGQPARFE